jgi:hypothetical protein
LNRIGRIALLALLSPLLAGAAGLPQLIEIRDADCLPCDAMAAGLRSDPRWTPLQGRLAQRTLDRTRPEAAALLRQHPVGRVPSWLLLNADGEELGRVAGPQTADAFYARIDTLLAQRTTAAARRYRATDISSEGAAATAEALQDFHSQGLGDAGFAWWLRLPIAVRGQHTATPEVQRWRNRIEFLQAAQRGQPQAADIGGLKVLADPALGCDRGIELDRYIRSTVGLPAATRHDHLAAQLPALQVELARGWQAEPPACVDGLSLALVLADLQAALGDQPAERAGLSAAIGIAERRAAASADTIDRRALQRLQTRLAAVSTTRPGTASP